ncbi:MAG: hypothetical protein KDA87_23210 [Planctomycetales bacterium]|nr:hypothetical protein [Planctomycetales bacterium]
MFDGKLDGNAMLPNSVALKDKAVDWLQQHQPTTIELYRDNDRSGEELATRGESICNQPECNRRASLQFRSITNRPCFFEVVFSRRVHTQVFNITNVSSKN